MDRKKRTSDTLTGFLQLDTISKQNVQIKAFGDTKGRLKELGEFNFVLRGWNDNGLRIYLSSFSVPVVCGSVNGQKVKLVKKYLAIHFWKISNLLMRVCIGEYRLITWGRILLGHS